MSDPSSSVSPKLQLSDIEVEEKELNEAAGKAFCSVLEEAKKNPDVDTLAQSAEMIEKLTELHKGAQEKMFCRRLLILAKDFKNEFKNELTELKDGIVWPNLGQCHRMLSIVNERNIEQKRTWAILWIVTISAVPSPTRDALFGELFEFSTQEGGLINNVSQMFKALF